MGNSPLGRLPAEITNVIYKEALLHTEPITLGDDGRPRESVTRLLALTTTCKQIHVATSDMIYSINTFGIIYCTPGSNLWRPRDLALLNVLDKFRALLAPPHAVRPIRVVLWCILVLPDSFWHARLDTIGRLYMIPEFRCSLEYGNAVQRLAPDTRVNLVLMGRSRKDGMLVTLCAFKMARVIDARQEDARSAAQRTHRPSHAAVLLGLKKVGEELGWEVSDS